MPVGRLGKHVRHCQRAIGVGQFLPAALREGAMYRPRGLPSGLRFSIDERGIRRSHHVAELAHRIHGLVVADEEDGTPAGARRSRLECHGQRHHQPDDRAKNRQARDQPKQRIERFVGRQRNRKRRRRNPEQAIIVGDALPTAEMRP